MSALTKKMNIEGDIAVDEPGLHGQTMSFTLVSSIHVIMTDSASLWCFAARRSAKTIAIAGKTRLALDADGPTEPAIITWTGHWQVARSRTTCREINWQEPRTGTMNTRVIKFPYE